MAQQRQVSPIPPGRYWITVQGRESIEDFSTWLDEQRGSVVVESSSLETPEGPLFVIFRVPEGRAPFLSAAAFGFPSIAPANVTSIQDVEQAPIVQPPTLTDFGRGLGEFFHGAGAGLGISGIGTLVLIWIALQALSGASRPRRRRLAA